MLLRPALFLTLFTALVACAGTVERYSVPAEAEATLPKLSSRYRTVEVRLVSLPAYAASEEIATRSEAGAITSNKALLWADEPARAMTLELARYLGLMTRAQVAAEPWPFLDRASALVDVRVEEMVADATGVFVLKGQYYVAPDSGIGGRSGLFDLVQPVTGEGAGAIAAARGAAVRALAEQVVRSGLR